MSLAIVLLVSVVSFFLVVLVPFCLLRCNILERNPFFPPCRFGGRVVGKGSDRSFLGASGLGCGACGDAFAKMVLLLELVNGLPVWGSAFGVFPPT